jgi:hypothetical protein
VANGQPEEIAQAPRQFANVPPPDISGGSATNVIVREFRDDIREIKRDQKTDFRILTGIFGTGVVVIGGMLFYAYFRIDDKITKLEDRVSVLTTTVTRIDTKLEDLLARIPPAQTPVPHRP